MTTPITKEWLQKAISEMEAARDDIPFGLDEDGNNTLLALKMALTSLSAEPVGEVSEQPDGLVMDGMVHLGGSRTHRVIKGLNKMKRLPLGTKFYTAPPAPVVSDEMPCGGAENEYQDGYQDGWNACRAAMLQGADGNAPAHFRSRPAQSSISPAQGGNSPVIPDGWVACSERMPDNDDFVYIWPRPDFGVELHVAQYGKFDKRDAGWYAQVYEQNYGIEYYPIKVTHWMALPAAPQQEISHALAKGMERYGDAMQELAKREVK